MRTDVAGRRKSPIVFGANPVHEALRAGQVVRVWASDRAGSRVEDIAQVAERQGVAVHRVDPAALGRRVPNGATHQGIVAECRVAPELDLEALIDAARDPALILVLDGVIDPRNLGALLRTAEAAGVDGVVRQRRRAAPLTGAAARASAGATAHVRVTSVVNVARALDQLKTRGAWVIGLSHDAVKTYDEVDMTGPVTLVVGAEGQGMRRLVRERCDWLVRIPMSGRIGSLNVSVAAGVALFEVLRQRRVHASDADAGRAARPAPRERGGG